MGRAIGTADGWLHRPRIRRYGAFALEQTASNGHADGSFWRCRIAGDSYTPLAMTRGHNLMTAPASCALPPHSLAGTLPDWALPETPT